MVFFRKRSSRFRKLAHPSLSEQEAHKSPDVTKLCETEPTSKARIFIGKAFRLSNNKAPNNKAKQDFALRIGGSNTTELISESDTLSLNSFSFAQHFSQQIKNESSNEINESVLGIHRRIPSAPPARKTRPACGTLSLPSAAKDDFFAGLTTTKCAFNPFANTGNLLLADAMGTRAPGRPKSHASAAEDDFFANLKTTGNLLLADDTVTRAPRRPKSHPSAVKDDGFADLKTTKSVYNPFANNGNIFLAEDMSTLAEAMRLDTNTQTMLAYYDAKTLEDFCMMAEADLRDMIDKAETMKRALAPLQIRKVEVLRDWAQKMCEPEDDKSNLPAWIRITKAKTSNNGDSIVPSDWKKQFDRDLPKLKEALKEKAESMRKSASAFQYAPSFKSVSMCGSVGYEI